MTKLNHQRVWAALDRLAEQHGLSPSALAKKAGLDATAFNPSKRQRGAKSHWPSTESLARVLAATGTSITDFAALVNDTPPANRVLPVIGYAEAGREGYFDADGHPTGHGWDEIANGIADPAAFAIEVSGKSMEPVYREGDRLIVSPTAEIRRGDRVVARLASGEVLVKELARRSAKAITLHSLNPAFPDLTVPLNDVRWMHRIVLVGQ